MFNVYLLKVTDYEDTSDQYFNVNRKLKANI